MLINFEGPDGAGKSTQIKIIKKYYESKNMSVKNIHFPMYGHNKFSDVITKFLKGNLGNIDQVDPLFLANIYAMDRYCYKNQLIEDIKNFDVVIMDRYVFSNVAFQCAKVNDKLEKNKLFNWILDFEFGFLDLPYPDLILYFDLPMYEIKKRLFKNRSGDDREYLNGKSDVHEKDIELQEKVKELYQYIGNGQLIFKNDGEMSNIVGKVQNYHIIKAHDNGVVLSPDNLFESYKNLLK